MTRSRKAVSSANPARKQAVIYARVSSKEQERGGFSIPAQLKLLKEYAAANGFAVAQEYVDVETAKQTGRAAFGEMITHLKAQPSIRILLMEKTDRLYRNLKDWVTVDDLEVEIHFVKEGVVLSRGSRSSEKFMHGIKVLMAKNYIDNLSEEARKGMQEKAEQGIWPTVAPLGYRNMAGADGLLHSTNFSDAPATDPGSATAFFIANFIPSDPCFGGAVCSASGPIVAYDSAVQVGMWDITIEATPLPAALPLFATGLGGLGLLGWRRKRKAQAVA